MEQQIYTRAGYCPYCGTAHMVDRYRQNEPQMIIDNAAAWKCNCEEMIGQKLERVRLKQALIDAGKIEQARKLGAFEVELPEKNEKPNMEELKKKIAGLAYE